MTTTATATRATVQAAGALVWRVSGRRLEVLLVHRPRYDDWAWPKGKLDPGETLVACAVREVAEETGVHVALGQPLGAVRYRLPDGRVKHSHYWAAHPLGDGVQSVGGRDLVVPAEATEIDEVRWVEAKKAAKLLTYSHDRELLGLLVDQWQDDRLATRTIVVLRHARARKRSTWSGGEASRPLTPAGQEQAARLVPLLSAYGVEEVITSPWERCAATVRPYLEATGIGAELRPELTETAHAKRARPVRELIRRELGRTDVPLALCTHRPVLPTVLTEIAERTPNRIAKQLPDGDPWLKTGQVLVIHVARRGRRRAAVVAVERHRPAM